VVHTWYDNWKASFIHSFIHRSAPQWWESMRSCLIRYDGNVLSFPTWRNGPFQDAKHRFPSDHTGPEWLKHPPAHHPSTGCLNTDFHKITLGQSDSAPTGAPSIHWMPELVVDELEPLSCPARPCWPTVIDKQTCWINI